MSPTRPAGSPPVRIEADNESAWCGERRLQLTPKVFAVLRHLVEHPQRLITKDDLLATVWRDAIVSDAALASCIRDLRKALRDTSEAPRYVETVHRRGFRFIGPIASPPPALAAQHRFAGPEAQIREVARVGRPRHVRVAAGIHRDAEAAVIAVAAQVRRVDEGRAARVELGELRERRAIRESGACRAARGERWRRYRLG
jgi:DNA-binding winged helix-turn-helix (wHTH) protein